MAATLTTRINRSGDVADVAAAHGRTILGVRYGFGVVHYDLADTAPREPEPGDRVIVIGGCPEQHFHHGGRGTIVVHETGLDGNIRPEYWRIRMDGGGYCEPSPQHRPGRLKVLYLRPRIGEESQS